MEEEVAAAAEVAVAVVAEAAAEVEAAQAHLDILEAAVVVTAE